MSRQILKPAELINLAELLLEPVNNSQICPLIDSVGNVCSHIEVALKPNPSDETMSTMIDDLAYLSEDEHIPRFKKVSTKCLSSFTADSQASAKRSIDNIEKLYDRAVVLYKEILTKVVNLDAASSPAAHK